MMQSTSFSNSDLESWAESNAPVWLFDIDSISICWANTSALAFWNASSLEELAQREFSGDSENVKARLSVILRTLLESDRHIEAWTLYPNNEPTHVKLQFYRFETETDHAILLIEVIEKFSVPLDVGSLRLLEVTRSMSSMITMMSLGGYVLMQNPAALKCYGPSLPSNSNSTDLQLRLLSVDDVDHVHAVVLQNKISQLSARVNTCAGPRTHSINIQRGRDPVSGDPVIVLSEDDISELSSLYRNQKQEATRLKQTVADNTDQLLIAKARIDRALEVAAIWDWDIATDKLYFSPNFMQLLQYEPTEFIQKLRTERFQSILHPGDYADYQQVLAGFLANPDKPISHEMRFATKSGEYLWIQIEGKCFCDDDGTPIRTTGLLTNITPKKQMEATLLTSQKLEAIGQLTGGIAHDFNNLLTVILGNVQLLERMGTPNAKLTSEIVSAVERGAELTRQLLAFARKQSLHPVPVDIGELSTKMCATLFRILSETISVNYKGQDDLWYAFADAAQIEAALLNIALNARDAMPSGGTITLFTENVTVHRDSASTPPMLASGDYVRIAISDTGTGMTPDTSAKAFDPFFSTKDVGQGTGLGLSMVLGFSQQSGGTTQISTELGIGTTISVYLPKAKEHITKLRTVADSAPLLGHGEHIHILEDNEIVSMTVSNMILSLGYQISSSGTAAAALAFANRHSDIDVFVVDVILPGGKSGVDFSSELLKTNSNAKLILVSGYPAAQLMRDKTRTLDFVFLPKPFSRAQMAKALADTLGK